MIESPSTKRPRWMTGARDPTKRFIAAGIVLMNRSAVVPDTEKGSFAHFSATDPTSLLSAKAISLGGCCRKYKEFSAAIL